MATLREISKKIDVSIATISRVLNGSEKVSPETRKKVLKAIKEFDYRPNRIPKKKLHNVIGIIVPNIKGNHYNIIAEGIEEFLLNTKYDSFVTTTHQLINKEKELIEQFFSRRVDGIIICTSRNDEKEIEWLINSSIPVVTVDRQDTDIRVDTVGIDNFESAYKGIKYLYKMGHRRVLFVEGEKYIYSIRERREAVLYFAKRQKDMEVKVIEGNLEFEGGYYPVKEYLKRYALDFTAIFFSNDQMAVGGMHALFEAGLNVPSDVSVLGFDDDVYAKFLNPPLTTIRQPRRELGEMAARLITERIEGKGSKMTRRIILPTSIVERDSVKNIKVFNK